MTDAQSPIPPDGFGRDAGCQPESPAALRAFLGALPAAEFAGRQKDLDELLRAMRDSPRLAARHMALQGPAGSGKSELLRQAALQWSGGDAEATPVYFDLSTIPPAAAENPWPLFCRAILAWFLLRARRLTAEEFASAHAAPEKLAALCEEPPLRAWGPAGRLEKASAADATSLLGDCKAVGLHRPVILLDGAAQLPDAVWRAALESIVKIVAASGCALLMESPGDAAAPPRLETLEFRPLAPLDFPAALELLQAIGRRRGWALDAEAALPAIQRLGPWPGWLRAWAFEIRMNPARHPRRIAEEAYLNLLTASPWAARFSRRFDAAIPLPLRESALRLERCATQGSDPLSAAEALACLAATDSQADAVMGAMTALGLLSRRGMEWSGPAEPLLADWCALQTSRSARDANPAALRAAMLTRLLSAPPEFAPQGEILPVARLLPDVLGRFAAQDVPDLLFEFHNFYEALARLDPHRRRQAVASAHRSLRLPEIVGVVPPLAAAGTPGSPPIHYARGYRDGKYQRAAEEIWVAVDLSATRALTTPEIQAAQAGAERLRQKLGAGNYALWLIVGESASGDALELLRREKIYCSNREQLSMLRELLRDHAALRAAGPAGTPIAELPQTPDGASGSPNPLPAAAPNFIAGNPAGTPPPRRSVIEMRPDAASPASETSSLTLPAREDSEYIAALMAEKVAIRADFSPADAGKIKTSVLEGVLNAIEHSANPEKLIEIQFRLRRDVLEVLIENEGAGFDPLAVPEPDPRRKLAAANKRGWGITLMKKFMDSVDYEPCTRGTRLRLVKRRAAPRRDPMEAGQQNNAGL